MINKVRGYIFSRPFMGERVPQHVQNLVIRDYCEQNQLNYLLSATEYAMEGCHLIFEHVLSELDEISGIVAYSLFQLPEEKAQREKIYQKIIEKQKVLYFAVEGLRISKKQDFEKIEALWMIQLAMKN
jgi:sporadic carbohydrate cluster protein (TIGR04323 family)